MNEPTAIYANDRPWPWPPQAVKCPVCNGTGIYDAVQPTDTVTSRPQTCHGCNGKGWVKI